MDQSFIGIPAAFPLQRSTAMDPPCFAEELRVSSGLLFDLLALSETGELRLRRAMAVLGSRLLDFSPQRQDRGRGRHRDRHRDRDRDRDKRLRWNAQGKVTLESVVDLLTIQMRQMEKFRTQARRGGEAAVSSGAGFLNSYASSPSVRCSSSSLTLTC